MTNDQMRREVRKVYGQSWDEGKSDAQIAAIYNRLLNAGKLKK